MAEKTFLDTYNETIAPKLAELDVFLKAKEEPFTIWQAAQLLEIPYQEAENILQQNKINKLDSISIFLLVLYGNSKLCRLIRHEKERGFPLRYTPEDIAFIYELDRQKVQNAYRRIGQSEIGREHLDFLFRLLPA